MPATLDPVEYPGGVAPEVIARGRNVVGRTKPDGLPGLGRFTIVDPREFGLLGAYDGLLPAANVGRVVVDSTWHHWFNVNLRGLDNIPHSINYKDILAYFRNVAVWLAPKERQNRMRLTGQVLALFTQSMVERTLTIRELRPELFYPIGIEARDALARIAPQCQMNIWLIELLASHFPQIRERIEDVKIEEEPDLWESYVLDRLLITALGGAMASLAVAMRKSDDRDGDAVIEAADEIVLEGLSMGLKYAQDDLGSTCKRFEKAIRSVLKTGDKSTK